MNTLTIISPKGILHNLLKGIFLKRNSANNISEDKSQNHRIMVLVGMIYFISLPFSCLRLRKLISSKSPKSVNLFLRLNNFSISDVLLKSRQQRSTVIFLTVILLNVSQATLAQLLPPSFTNEDFILSHFSLVSVFLNTFLKMCFKSLHMDFFLLLT